MKIKFCEENMLEATDMQSENWWIKKNKIKILNIFYFLQWKFHRFLNISLLIEMCVVFGHNEYIYWYKRKLRS